MDKKKLSIIIVSWNVCKDVLQCIGSIHENPPSASYEVILVDNHSSDDTACNVQQNYPGTIVIENQENLGFAAANNIGIQKANGQYLFFLNPDTIIQPHSLDLLLQYMQEHPQVGICGPKIINPDLTIQRSVRQFPTFKAIFYRFTILKYLGLFRKHLYQWKMRDFDHQTEIPAQQLIGAALIAQTSLIQQLGGFDERFFMYYEEVDLCLRTINAGLEVMFYPEPEIIHLGGQSAKQIPARVRFMMLNSLVLFMKKHHRSFQARLLLLLFKFGVFTRQFFEMTIYFLAAMCTIPKKALFDKNISRANSCFKFLTRFYLRFLFS